MSKLKNPLVSLGAVGGLTKALAFARRRKVDLIEKKPIPTDRKSPAQLSWRHMYQKAVALWHALSPAEKLNWESDARPKHMTGFAWFMSQCLRPNPGIYLPLQGGIMQGDIDMDKHLLTKLPAPTTDQQPIIYGDEKSAHVHHDSNQSINNNVYTHLSFNSERWDTDEIHDNAVNNSRLTCKTTGYYLITGACRFHTNATGLRIAYININGTTRIALNARVPLATTYTDLLVTTLYYLEVGDYATLEIFQNSGVALLSRLNPQYSPEFMMQRLV